MKANLVKLLKSKLFKFLLVAGASALFELVLYTILFEVLNIHPITSSPIAQIASMVFNFTLNKLFTFGTGKKFRIKEAVGYFIIWLLNLFVTTVLMAYLISNTLIYPTVIRFVVMVIMFLFNYIVMKKFVFKES